MTTATLDIHIPQEVLADAHQLRELVVVVSAPPAKPKKRAKGAL